VCFYSLSTAFTSLTAAQVMVRDMLVDSLLSLVLFSYIVYTDFLHPILKVIYSVPIFLEEAFVIISRNGMVYTEVRSSIYPPNGIMKTHVRVKLQFRRSVRWLFFTKRKLLPLSSIVFIEIVFHVWYDTESSGVLTLTPTALNFTEASLELTNRRMSQ
jgi:hypothetical protein